ncbi:hypothetical protein HKD37_13G037007 [Glycine soja]
MKLNHGGNFIRHPILKYAGGDKTLLLDIDEDKWSFFELVGILKDDANCTGDFKLWWTGVPDISIKELALDSDALELENFALSNNIEVLVYVEKINDGGVVVSKGDVEHLMVGTKVLGMKLLGSKLLLGTRAPTKKVSKSGRSTLVANEFPTKIDSLKKLSELTKGQSINDVIQRKILQSTR